MEMVFLTCGILLFLLALLVLLRVIIGPTAIDRIVAVNMVGTQTTVLLILMGILFSRVDMFVDFALTYALLNFIGSLAAARYLLRTKPLRDTKITVVEVERG